MMFVYRPVFEGGEQLRMQRFWQNKVMQYLDVAWLRVPIAAKGPGGFGF